MLEDIKEKLEEANKLIFVKKYNKAATIIDDILNSKEGILYLPAHLRRIELAVRLKDVEHMRDQYIDHLEHNRMDKITAKLCIALAEQHGELVSHMDSIAHFDSIMKEHGEQAVAYFGIALSLESQGNYDRAIYSYQQSLKIDPSWYPSYFGLSQIYYNQNNPEKGDHYFYLFEQYAPYNLYGNFDTHKSLSQEFIKKHQFAEAQTAISSLTEWWFENRGGCPLEIQVYEALALGKIAKLKGEKDKEASQFKRASQMATSMLENPGLKDDVLYFIAKILEEFSHFDLALKFYRKILGKSQNDPNMIQRIGGQFLAMGEFELAKELFWDAYLVNPDQSEIRFCLLVSRLKIAKVNVEDYLIGKERLRQLLEHENDKVEVLSLLHSLLAKFQDDPDVHGYMGDIYVQLGHIEKAEKHYQKMHLIDPISYFSSFKFASFMITHRDIDEAKRILDKLQLDEKKNSEKYFEFCWLKSNYFAKKKQYDQALELVNKALSHDPWNVAYITHEIDCLTHTLYKDQQDKLDTLVSQLVTSDKKEIHWGEFDQQTKVIREDHHHRLVFSRCKLRFLFSIGDGGYLEQLVEAARKHDATKGIYDFLRLLNTNFDSPKIYFGLGILFKELWQLEIAGMWFEQILLDSSISDAMKAKVYIELADCYVSRHVHLTKALEYAKLALEMDASQKSYASLVLVQIYLKLGKVREAKLFLELVDKQTNGFEAAYLEGLLFYRNGAVEQAKRVWKPLLTKKSDHIRTHYFKQEILRFYFETESYLKVI